MKEIAYYEGRDLPMPARPVKPRHPARGQETADAFAQYAEDLRVYEEAMPAFRENQQRYRESLRQRQFECSLDLAAEHKISQAQAVVVWEMAWEEAHSSGFQDVIYKFEELVDLCRKFQTCH